MGAQLGRCSGFWKCHYLKKEWTDNRALWWGVVYGKKIAS